MLHPALHRSYIQHTLDRIPVGIDDNAASDDLRRVLRESDRTVD